MYAARKIRDTFRANKMINDFKEIDRQVASAKQSLELIRRQVSERSISCTRCIQMCIHTFTYTYTCVYVCMYRVHVLTGPLPNCYRIDLVVLTSTLTITIISTTTATKTTWVTVCSAFLQVIIGHLYTTDKLVIEQKKTLRPSDDWGAWPFALRCTPQRHTHTTTTTPTPTQHTKHTYQGTLWHLDNSRRGRPKTRKTRYNWMLLFISVSCVVSYARRRRRRKIIDL